MKYSSASNNNSRMFTKNTKCCHCYLTLGLAFVDVKLLFRVYNRTPSPSTHSELSHSIKNEEKTQ